MLAIFADAALSQAALPKVPAKPAATVTSGALAWSTLNASQQEALRPLAPIWSRISQNSKHKWIALSSKYGKLSADEQATLHGRMAEWATLSNSERNRARLNFSETRSLSSAEKKAQWEAYQALSPAQKQHLAQEAAKRPHTGAAPAVSARSRGKLAAVPTTRSQTGPRGATAPINRASHPVPAASAAIQPAPAASAATLPKE